jgi:choline dehydrogenase-like flavoprotein
MVGSAVRKLRRASSFRLLGPDTAAEESQLRLSGQGLMGWIEAGGFLKSSEDLAAPDIQLHAALGIVRDQGLAAPLEAGMSFGPYVGCPKSRGSVRLRHSHPYSKPRIAHNYLAESDDWHRLRVGLRACMEIAAQPAFIQGVGSTLSQAAASGCLRHSPVATEPRTGTLDLKRLEVVRQSLKLVSCRARPAAVPSRARRPESAGPR